MSYDLIARIKYKEKTNVEKRIITFFKKYGFNILLHPEFDFLSCAGLNPIVIKSDSKFWKRFPNAPDYDVITGHELFTNDLRQWKNKTECAFNKVKAFFHKKINTDLEITHTCISVYHENYILSNHVISCLFAVAIADTFDGNIEDIHKNYCVPHKELRQFMNFYLNHYVQDMEPNDGMLRFNDWYDGQIAFGCAGVDKCDEENGTMSDYKWLKKKESVSLLYPPTRLSAIFRNFGENMHSMYCIKAIPDDKETDGIRYETVLVGERKDFPRDQSICGTFDVSLPIKKVDVTKQRRIITAEGIYEGKVIGFKLEIPLTVQEILSSEEDNVPFGLQEKQNKEVFITHIILKPTDYDCKFISLGEPTKNLFNALRIGNFKNIKSNVEFVFNNLIGDMERVNKDCENTIETQAGLTYAEFTYGRRMKDTDLRFKIETYYDDDKKHQLINGDDDPQELAFLIDISPEEKRLYFSEKDTSNRHNLKYTFIDHKK